MIRCPNCGTDNQDAAKFCRTCGKPMPATRTSGAPPSPALPPQPTQMPQRLPLQSSRAFQTNLTPVPATAPAPSPTRAPVPTRVRPLTTRIGTTINPGTQLRGVVIDDPTERRDLPLHDWTKWMISLAIIILVAPPLLLFFFTTVVVMCVVAILGAGAVLTCLVLPLTLGLGVASFMRPPQRAEVPYYELRVQQANGDVVNVEMIGKRRGGRIYRGDEIEAEGEWLDAYQSALRAWRVRVVRVASAAGQQHAGAEVIAERPWPRIVGVIALGVSGMIAVALYVIVPLVMSGMGTTWRPW